MVVSKSIPAKIPSRKPLQATDRADTKISKFFEPQAMGASKEVRSINTKTISTNNSTRRRQSDSGTPYLLIAAVVMRSRHRPLSLKNHSLW